MEWYYAVNDQRLGPVSEPEFSRLVAAGEIRPETFVWRDGMATWQPLRDVPREAPSPAAVCAECGTVFPEDELVSIDARQVCAACKPTVLQRVREGVLAAVAERDLAERPLPLPELIALSWSFWLRNLGVILLLTLLTAIPSNLLLEAMPASDAPDLREVGRMFRVTMLFEILLGSLSTIGIAFVVAESAAGRDTSFGEALRHAVSRWLSAIGTGFLENIIVGLLCLLLIVPGIIWMGYYTFVIYVVALRDRGGMRALSYSKALVRGRWWRVVGFVCALLLLTLMPMIAIEIAAPTTSGATSVISGIATDLVMSFMTVAVCVLFLNLDALQQAGRLE